MKTFEVGHHSSKRRGPQLSDEFNYEDEEVLPILERWGDRTWNRATETERSYRFQD